MLIAVAFMSQAVAAGQLKTGDAFPDLSEFGLRGELPALDGKVVMVDFWASWCGPCKKSFPSLSKLQNRYREQGLVIIGVSVDQKASAMERFLEDNPVSFTTVLDAKHSLVAAASVKSMPTSFLMDREGAIRFIHNGFHGKKTVDELTEQIEELLE
jgi:thiol-disulfide isomerase/thioredoxin